MVSQNMENLKFVLAFVLLTLPYVLSETPAELKKACEKEYNVSSIELINFEDPNISNEVKCAWACRFEKRGLFKDDGSIDKAKEKERIEKLNISQYIKKAFLKTVDECDSSAKSTKCDTAFQFVKCQNHKVAAETSGVWDTCENEHKFRGIRNISLSDKTLPREAKCFFACLLEKYGMFKEDGSIDMESEKKRIENFIKNPEHKKRILKSFEECDTSAKSDKCDTAFEFMKCRSAKEIKE